MARAPATLLYSSRTADDIIYRAELERLGGQDGVKVAHTLTRMQPPGWDGFSRRIDRAMLEAVGFPLGARPRIFICGPTPLVEAAASALRDIGHAPNLIKTERFRPNRGFAMNDQQNSAAPLDGNAEGGLLRELFAPEVTAAEITCDGCGAVAAVGAIRVFAAAMGAVFRCAHCDTVVLRVTHTPRGIFLDMRGARRLFVAASEL